MNAKVEDYKDSLSCLQSTMNMLTDKINHFDIDNPGMDVNQKKDQLGQLQFSLRLCEETIEKNKQAVEELLRVNQNI